MKLSYSLSLTLLLFIVLFTAADCVEAQSYDMLLKGGHVIAPRNGIDGTMDVALKDGKIARVASNISASDAEQVVDASGLYVTPGLIDQIGRASCRERV